MITLSDAGGISGTDPVATMWSRIGTLRKRYIISRLIFILSAALTADLIYSLIALGSYKIWGLKISIPFFFEILLLILFTRELPDWKIDHLASLFDKRFHLKDRLYSYIWYSNNFGIGADIRKAQASESLSSIDFPHILDQTRIRFPYYLMTVLLISAGLLYNIWNSDYRPPGVTTRIISNTVATNHPTINATSGPDRLSRDPGSDLEADDIVTPLQVDMENVNLSSPTSVDRSDPDQMNDREDTLASGDLQPGDDTIPGETSAPGEMTGQGQIGSGKSGRGTDTTPEVIKSILESETVSEPIPPLLKNSSSYAFEELPDATRFLSLIPGQGEQSLASLDPETISNFEAGIDRFPDLYKDHLQTYYQELKKWNKNP